MAVRRPLILDGDNNLIEMTDAQIEDVQDRCRYTYGANPSVTLSVVSSGGSLGALTETRLKAGAASQSTTATPSQSTTADVTTIDGNTNDKTEQSAANTTASVDTNNVAFPIFQTSVKISKNQSKIFRHPPDHLRSIPNIRLTTMMMIIVIIISFIIFTWDHRYDAVRAAIVTFARLQITLQYVSQSIS